MGCDADKQFENKVWEEAFPAWSRFGDDDDELMLNVLRCHLTY